MDNQEENLDQTAPSIQLEKGSQKPPKKPMSLAKKVSFSVLAFFLLLLLSIPLILNFYAERIFGEAVRQIVRNETGGRYAFGYDKLGFNLFFSELTIKNLSIFPDSTYQNMDSAGILTPQKLVELNIPDLHFTGSGIYNVIRKKELVVSRFYIGKPGLKLYLNLPAAIAPVLTDSMQGPDSSQRILHTYLKDYLKLLKIIDFELSEGSLEIIRGNAKSSQSVRITDFSLLFSNLQIDSLSNQSLKHLLLSDSLGVSLKTGYFEFLGKSHQVTFNNIEISIEDRTLLVSGLSIKPDTTKAGYSANGWLEMTVPSLKLNGFDFQLFVDKELSVSEITVVEPDILFHPAKGGPKEEFDREKLAKQIFEALSKIFYPIEVGEISIQSASFSIDGFDNKDLKEFYLPDFSLDLHHLKLDSASYNERSQLFFVDDLRLIMNVQEFFLKKKAMLIKIGYLDLDTRNSQLELCDVFVEDNRKSPKTATINLQIPGLNLIGKNFKQDFFDNKFRVLTLDIQEPAITVLIPDSVSQDSKKLDLGNLYPLIRGFLTELSVARFNINSANFNFGRFEGLFSNQVSSPDISLAITDFLLNKNASKNPDKIFYSSAIEINASNLALVAPDSIHQLFFDQLTVSTKDSAINISGLHADTLDVLAYKPFFAKDKDRLNLNIDKITLQKIDFPGYINNQFIEIGNVEINKPVGYFVDVLSDQDTKTEENRPLPDFQIAHLKINGGDFYLKESPGKSPKKIALDGLNLVLDCLQPESKGRRNKISAENIELSSENLMLYLSEKGYSVEMNELNISSADSLISASNLIIQPTNPAGAEDKFIVRAKIPGFFVRGIALRQLYENNTLQASAISLEKPSYRLIIPGKPSANNNTEVNGNTIRDEVLKIFHSVDIGQFEMKSADLEVFGGTTFSSRDLLIDNFDFEIASFFVDSLSEMTPQNLFFAGDISFLAQQPIKASVGDNFEVSFGKLSGSAKEGFLKAENVFVNGKGLNQHKDQPQKITEVELALKNLDLRGIDFYKLVTLRKLFMERISATEPDVWLTREITAGIKETAENKEIDFYKLISGQIKELRIDDFDIADASFKIQDNKGANSESFQINRIDVDFRNILVDSSNMVFGDKFLYSDLFNLKISDYSILTPDSLYLLGASGAHFSSKNMMLKIDSGFVTPQFDEEVFSAKIGHQTDRFQLVFDSAFFKNIAIPELLFHNRLSISKVAFYQLIADDYRDKTYDLEPDHYASLPVSAFKKLPLIFSLDTLKVENSRIQYREYVPPAIDPGIIWFDRLMLEGRNITNDSVLISQNKTMGFIAKATLMSEAEMAFSVNFDHESLNDEFTATGTLNEFDLTSMNPFLENVAFVKVKKGTNNLLTFNFAGNNDVARGELFFNYDKLSIRLIDKETMQDKGFGESVASFIANNFIVRTDNPKYSVLFRKGQIYFERNKQKSFFSFVAKSVLSGISTTIRGGNEERKEKRRKRKLDDQARPEARLNENEEFIWLIIS